MVFLVIFLVGMVSAALPTPSQYNGSVRFRGINLSGAEFDVHPFPPYFAPTADDLETLALAGVNVVRYPLGWESMQPQSMGPLDEKYMSAVVPAVSDILEAGYSVLLDLHAYMRYDGSICSAAELADVWTKILSPDNSTGGRRFGTLAKTYGGSGDESGVQLMLDIMNEPHDMPSTKMVQNYNAALSAVRKLGLKNLAALEGNGYSGMHAWMISKNGEPPNAKVMLPGSIVDPANHWIVNVHQYLDVDSSGSHPDCISSSEFPSKINFTAFSTWLESNNMRAFLSEFGAPYNPNCIVQEQHLLDLVVNTSSFIGFTAWSAGHAWGNHYFMGLNPGDEAQAMVVASLGKYWTSPTCDPPGYLLSFNSTPIGITTGYSVQLHSPDWKYKSSIASASNSKTPPGLTCIPPQSVQQNQDQIALYDENGKQYICSQIVNTTNPVLDLSTCK